MATHKQRLYHIFGISSSHARALQGFSKFLRLSETLIGKRGP